VKRHPKPSRASSWVSRRLSFSQKHRDSQKLGSSEIAILSLSSFCHENGEIGVTNAKNDHPQHHRKFSIPTVLMNATLSHEKSYYKVNSIDNSQLEDLQGMKNISRGRLVSLMADKLQQRPVYTPYCHPVDLEGLQETAV